MAGPDPSLNPAAPEAPAGYGTGPVPPGALRPPGAEAPAPLVLADWWRRAVAAIIDGLVVVLGALVVVGLFGLVFSVGFLGGDTAGVISVIVGVLIGLLAATAVALVYAPLLMDRTDGRTLGKLATGCRVVRVDGRRVDFWWAALREVLVKGLLFGFGGSLLLSIPTFADWLWPLWDGENRALHDMLVDSRVVMA